MFRRVFYKNRRFYDDDFDWDNYTADSYKRRVTQDIETQFGARFTPETISFDTESGVVHTKGAGMHPNHRLILEAIGQLAPASVHEVGCGGGDHVGNATALFPDVHVTGGDRGATQLDLALSRNPDLKGRLGHQDITMPYSKAWPKADLVYTQAVIMHIHTAVSHFVALSNLFHCANDHVLLVENLQCHNLVDDIVALRDGGHLPWDKVNLYEFTGSAGNKALLVSRHELNYSEAKSDAQLRAGLKPSQRRLKRAAEDSARAIFGFARR